jgi:hypothetical protein
MLLRYFIAAILLINALPGFCQVLGFSLADGKSKVTIPIEIHNNLVVMPVVLNGTLPLKFILDTGVRTSILTQKAFTDILNLTYTRKYEIAGPGGEKLIEAYITNNVSIDLPGVLGKGHALLVLEQDYLELRNHLGVDVHGILGYELFSRFIIEIDYEKKQLTIMNPKRFRMKRKFQAIPIRIEDTKPYVVTPVVLQDGTKLSGKFLIDSGASHGLMLDTESDTRITVPGNTVSSVIGRGLGGAIVGRVGRVKELQLGDFVLKDAIANFPDPNSYFDSLKTGRAERNGSIGGETLSRFTVVFNFSKEEMFLKKNHAFKKGFHYNMSGLVIRAKGVSLSKYEITDVRKNSNADQAGLVEGDIITVVNGLRTSILSLNGVNSMLNSRPGKRVTITVDRKGQSIKTKFQLQDPF